MPVSRRWRARARVSTPAMAGTPVARSRCTTCLARPTTAAVACATTRRAQPWPLRLVVLDEAAVVADEGIGHGHDLTGVRGVRGDLLVARLAGVGDQVATRTDRGPEGDAREDGAILERDEGRAVPADARIDHGVWGHGDGASRGGKRRSSWHRTGGDVAHRRVGTGGLRVAQSRAGSADDASSSRASRAHRDPVGGQPRPHWTAPEGNGASLAEAWPHRRERGNPDDPQAERIRHRSLSLPGSRPGIVADGP